MGYSKDEMETILNFDYETGTWDVYSTVPKHIRKIQSLLGEDVKVLDSEDDRPIAVRGTLSEKQVSMKNVRVMTEEQKQKASERGKLLHKNK
jgi:hypothetical protein